MLWLFLIMFLGTWAGGIWVQSSFAGLWDGQWLVFLAVGLVIALIFAALSHRRTPRSRDETLDILDRMETRKEAEVVTYITLSLFFWVLLVLLIVAIIFRYIL